MAVINGGPKWIGVDLDAIVRECHQKTESQQALRRQLELLREIWALFLNAQNDAKAWEQAQSGKRKRDEEDENGEDLERHSQSSQRTTRSQFRPVHSDAKSPSTIPNNDRKPIVNQRRGPGANTELTQTGRRKRALSSNGTTLTERAVLRLGKRQKTADLNMTVRHWVKSVCF